MLIYKVTNNVNNKIYIGQTIQTMKKRWHKHGKTNRNDYLNNAIQKYGKENFSIEQIDSAESIDELNEKEVYWIKFYNSTDRNIGYNIKDGGSNCSCPEETKIKIGLANKGRKPSQQAVEAARKLKKGQKLSLETCQKMSESRIGRIVSDETKQKLREARKTYIVSEETKQKQRLAKLGKKQAIEVIEKRRKANTGKKRSEEFKQSIRERKPLPDIGKRISEGKLNSNYKHSEETKQKQRENFVGRTGQKNKPESLQKMVLTKARKKLLNKLRNILDSKE